MKESLDNQFLMSLLSVYTKDSGLNGIMDTVIISQAISLTLQHLEAADNLDSTNHVDIFKKALLMQTVDSKNCSQIVGISAKTLYRYRLRYLSIFKHYLLQCGAADT